jgi:NAD(P)-dependent dehydrogenase (short-subunit alcohol dehydrogenase family)
MSDALFDLTGQVAIVTGTSRGLGQYFARALAKAGADLVITSRTRETLTDFENEIKALGRRAFSLELDVRSLESIEKMAVDAEDAFGQIHILVNNAGCNIRKPALDVTWSDWNQILDTNLRGTFFVAQAVARRNDCQRLRPHRQHWVGDQRVSATRDLHLTAPAAAACAS